MTLASSSTSANLLASTPSTSPRRSRRSCEDFEKTLPEGVELLTLYRQRDFIDLSIGNLEEALRDGAIMVAIVLFLFLFNFRVTLITLTAIPLSLAITILVFDLLDLSVNSMTLGGLAVAIGMVVDDAIVDVENVFRRLRENAALADPLPKLEVIARASAEVRSSIFYATVLIILVFVPLLALSGVEGRLFTPIAIATIVSMGASFVVSLTVIPVLSSFLLNPKPGGEHREGVIVRAPQMAFGSTLAALLARAAVPAVRPRRSAAALQSTMPTPRWAAPSCRRSGNPPRSSP